MKSSEATNQPSERKIRLMQSTPMVVTLALITTFLWGTAYPSIKIGFGLFGIEGISEQLVFAGSRFLGAGALLLLCRLLTGKSIRVPIRSIPGVVSLGVVMTTLEYGFYYLAMSNLTGTKGAIVNSANAFFGVLFAHFFTKNDRLTLQKTLGCVVGFLGVVVINFGGAENLFSFTLAGDGAMLVATAMFGLGGIISKYVTRTVDSMLATGWQLAIGGFLLILLGAPSAGFLSCADWRGWVVLGYMMLLSAIAFTLWTLLFQYNPAAKISIFALATPVFGVVCSGIFLGESIFELRNFVALALIVSGIYFVNRPSRSPSA